MHEKDGWDAPASPWLGSCNASGRRSRFTVQIHRVGIGGRGSGSSSADSSETFSIAVSWATPQLNSDGTSLPPTAINGYRVYYGTNPGTLTNSINVAGNNTAITGLAAGTYFLSVTTIDIAGNESARGAVVSATVP